MKRKKQREARSEKPGRAHKYVLIVLVLAVAAVGGVLTGDWLADRRAVDEEARRVDEYLGLGERTGLTGDLALTVEPMSVAVSQGDPIRLKLTLTNKTDEPMLLSSWFTPAPADFQSNQLPFKVLVSKAGEKVMFRGNAVLFPPHQKKDFTRLRPAKSKTVPAVLPLCKEIGRYDMSAPGEYTVEVWYETYLTGRYIGVNAWTGMTNHVIVRVTVRPKEGSQR